MSKATSNGGPRPVRVILSTVDSPEKALELARRWVEGGHAACVSIVPGARSVYRWRGEICDDAEQVLLIKTAFGSDDERERLIARLAGDHPYEEPEFLVLDPSGGASGYVAWVLEQAAERPT